MKNDHTKLMLCLVLKKFFDCKKQFFVNSTSPKNRPSKLFRCPPASCWAAIQGCLPAVQGCSAAVQGCLCPTRRVRAGTAGEQPQTAAKQPSTAAEQPCTAAEQLAGRQLNYWVGLIFGELKLRKKLFFTKYGMNLLRRCTLRPYIFASLTKGRQDFN